MAKNGVKYGQIKSNGVSVEWDDDDAGAKLAKQARHLSSQELAKAGAAAVNRAATAARAVGSRAVRGELALKAKFVKDRIKITRATPASIEAELLFDYTPVPLKHYGARQAQGWVSVRVKKSGARTKLRRAFVVGSMDDHVMMRTGDGDSMVPRGPIRRLHGPSVGSQLDNAVPAMRKRASEILGRRLSHEIQRRIDRANR